MLIRWEKVWPFIKTNLNPLLQRCFVPSLDEIGSVVLEKKILKISSMIFCYFVIISPWKLVWPFMWTNFVPSLVEIGPVVLEKKMKLWKVYRQTDRWQVIRKAHLCFQLKWAKKDFKNQRKCKEIQYFLNWIYGIYFTHERGFQNLFSQVRNIKNVSLVKLIPYSMSNH